MQAFVHVVFENAQGSPSSAKRINPTHIETALFDDFPLRFPTLKRNLAETIPLMRSAHHIMPEGL